MAAPGAGKRRNRKHFKPCHKCGWANEYAGDFMSENEKKWLKHVYEQHKMCSGQKSCEDAVFFENKILLPDQAGLAPFSSANVEC